MDVIALLLLLVGLAAGLACGLLIGFRNRVDPGAIAELVDGRAQAAQARASGDLEAKRAEVQGLVGPLQETLGRVEGQLRDIERARVDAYARLTEQVAASQAASGRLEMETAALVRALSKPQTRGRWGELQLRRVVELAGMVEHCDFAEQQSFSGDDGVSRPDLVVRLAGERHVVVDAKVSLAAYLEAVDTTDPAQRQARLAAHARHLRAHVDALASKAYWSTVPSTPEFVVLFVPGEAFLAPALEVDPTLLEHAMTRRVIVATPTTLMTILRSVAYSWQQGALADSAREVFDLGRELYDRLGRLGEHVDKLGRSLGRVVGDYNSMLGSLETRVLVSARRLADLKIVEADLPAPRVVDAAPRGLSNPVLLDAASMARPVRAVRDARKDTRRGDSAAEAAEEEHETPSATA